MGADHHAEFQATATRSRRSCASPTAAASMSRSRRSAPRRRSRRRCACCSPGGTLSSLGVYSSDLTIPLDAFAAGLGDHKIVTTLCPGGKERMRRLMEVIAVGPRGSEADGDAPLQARRHRGRLRTVRQSARRRAESRDYAVAGPGSGEPGPDPPGGDGMPCHPLRSPRCYSVSETVQNVVWGETVQILGVVTPPYETDDEPIARRCGTPFRIVVRNRGSNLEHQMRPSRRLVLAKRASSCPVTVRGEHLEPRSSMKCCTAREWGEGQGRSWPTSTWRRCPRNKAPAALPR